VLKAQEELSKAFTMNWSPMSPEQFDDVGMKILYDKADHAFLITQPGMVKKITEGIDGIEDLPYDSKIHQETDAEKLEDLTRYRSQVMELNYLAKTRMDLKVAVGYLATRMQEPTKGDETKLIHLKKYVNGTKELKLRLKPIDVIQVYASADASYGAYKDGKSNTGSMITIGFPNAPIYAKTGKQKTVAQFDSGIIDSF